jgi:hypothetical protein
MFNESIVIRLMLQLRGYDRGLVVHLEWWFVISHPTPGSPDSWL